VSLWRQLTRGLRTLAHRRAADRDVADEVEHYFDEAAADLEARGLSPEEARRQARTEFGNTAYVAESVRSYGWENLVETFFADVRHAARRLGSDRGFAAVAVLTLALGIGASTAILSAVIPILFEPLPYPQSGRIAMIWVAGSGGARSAVAFHTFREVAERSRSFETLAVMKPWQPTLSGADAPERFDGQQVSPGILRTLGVAPALGRDFEASDDVPKGPRVVILGDGLWRRRFGADPAIVGRTVRLDSETYTVIGVMPRGFQTVLAPSAEAWSPLQYETRNAASPETREWGHHLTMIGRLRPGVSIGRAARELAEIARSPVADFPRPRFASLEQGFLVSSLRDDITRGVRPALLAVLGAVLVVLLIACVNVTNLLLARAAQRRGEFAVRAALGAQRGRIARQLVTESLLLSLLGGALGLAVAQLGVRGLVAVSPPQLPRAAAIGVDAAVFVCALGLTALIGVVVGLVPARHASRASLQAGLQESSRRSTGHQWTRRTLVVVEVALALVLLVSAGLLLSSLRRLLAVPPGFEASHLLTMQVQTYGRHYDDDEACHRFFEQALDAVRQVPGVTSAAFTTQLPLSGDRDAYGARFEGDGEGVGYGVYRYAVTPGFFETLGIPLKSGRLVDEHDTAGSPRAVVISQALARLRFPGVSPLGKRLHLGGPVNAPWDTVVGVVGDVKQESLALSQSEAVYIMARQWHWADGTRSLLVRGQGDVAALAPAIQRAIWSVDPEPAIVRVATMDDLVRITAAERRFVLLLFEAFALAALALAATGIYGVLSGSVAERTREIGVRSALGASRGSILTLVVRQGMTLTGLGVAIGVVGAVAASQAIVTLLFGVSRLDPVTYFGVIALLGGVAAVACAVPAWRAARVDPAITLRAE
jgi:putative ABC transport system permease protein